MNRVARRPTLEAVGGMDVFTPVLECGILAVTLEAVYMNHGL